MTNRPNNLNGTTDQLQGHQVELILRQMESLPTLPAVAVRLLTLTASSRSEAREVIELIRADQSLTARLLSMAARVDAGLARDARTIERVVLMLGFEAVRSAVLGIKVFEMFDKSDSDSGLDRSEFWKHSLAVACAAESLAGRMRLGIDPEEIFVCGLLHDLGKLALEQCLPKSYTRTVEACAGQCGNIAEYERRIIGVDHTIVGRRLAQQWQLPALIEQTIWLHHQPIGGIPEVLPGRKAIALIHLADTVVREQRFGFSGNYSYAATSGKLAAEIGVSETVLDETIAVLPKVIERRAKMLGLRETTPEHLYRSALSGANEELSRLNARLRRQAQAAAARARGFALLRDFQAQLGERDTLTEVCQLLTTVWASAGGIAVDADQPVTAYAFAASDRTAVFATNIGTDDAELTVMPGKVGFPPPSPPAAKATVAEVLARIVEDRQAAPPHLSEPTLTHQALICGDQWVGGLIWTPTTATEQLNTEPASAVITAMAFAVGVIQARDRANVLAEHLGQSAQQLYAAQHALTETRALAAVGEMAAGAAHEINNPLAIVAGRAQLMAESARGEDRQTWQIMADQAQRISDIVTDMMDFAKPSKPRRRLMTARELLEAVAEAARGESGLADMGVSVNVGADTPSLSVDIEQMTAVLLELMRNARAAMDTNPRVSLSATLDDVTGNALLRIIDTGAGMDAETINKAFTPFYSAHPAGRRRGMGLSRARRLVQLAGGRIWLASTPDEGTTVFIQLPPAEDAAQGSTPGKA